MQISRRIRTAAAAVTALALGLSVINPVTGPADAQSIPGVVSGVDVAGHQRPGGAAIDWRSVSTVGGQDFAYVKASEGDGWKNDFYDEDAKAAADAGLKVGAYHYARPAEDPVAQARYFASVVNDGPATQLPPVLDLEVDEGLGPVQLAGWTQAFLSELEARTGKRPMIYTYRYFWYERMNDTRAFTSYPLWLAAYQNRPPATAGTR